MILQAADFESAVSTIPPQGPIFLQGSILFPHTFLKIVQISPAIAFQGQIFKIFTFILRFSQW
jgi:hypothetical protein